MVGVERLEYRKPTVKSLHEVAIFPADRQRAPFGTRLVRSAYRLLPVEAHLPARDRPRTCGRGDGPQSIEDAVASWVRQGRPGAAY